MLLQMPILVLDRKDAELRVDGDDTAGIPGAVALEIGLDDVAHPKRVEGVGKLDADGVYALPWHVALKVAVVIQDI